MVNANPGPQSAHQSCGSLAAASPPAVGWAGTAGWSSAHFRRPLRVATGPAPRVSALGLRIDLPCSPSSASRYDSTLDELVTAAEDSGPECRWRDPRSGASSAPA